MKSNAELLGHKVGDMFLVTNAEANNDSGFTNGCKVMLDYDDYSDCPRFKNIVTGATYYLYFSEVTKVQEEVKIEQQSVDQGSTTGSISIKEFLESMPKSAGATVIIQLSKTNHIVYSCEFDCPTEERLQEVMAALTVLYKGDV